MKIKIAMLAKFSIIKLMNNKPRRKNMAKKTYAKKDINIEITNQILLSISKGVAPWHKGWTPSIVGGTTPFNLDSEKQYNGFFNTMSLACRALGDVPAFAPYNKAHPTKKGAKGVKILKPRMWKTEDKKTGEEKKVFGGCTYITVFHYTDLQNVDADAIRAKYAPKTDGTEPVFDSNAKCDAVVEAMPNAPRIEHDGRDKAYYMPSKDFINLPKKTDFHSSSEYYATLFHELAHSTGHFTRLDRFKETKESFKSYDHEYSFEELVAELTACFVGSECGIMNQQSIDNSASYLNGWAKKLQTNTDWILKASSLATKASNYILAKS